jgi:hypothetical protein
MTINEAKALTVQGWHRLARVARYQATIILLIDR